MNKPTIINSQKEPKTTLLLDIEQGTTLFFALTIYQPQSQQEQQNKDLLFITTKIELPLMTLHLYPDRIKVAIFALTTYQPKNRKEKYNANMLLALFKYLLEDE